MISGAVVIEVLEFQSRVFATLKKRSSRRTVDDPGPSRPPV